MAILLVLLVHAGIAQGGRVGVDLFFVLSGFLITTILLEEQKATGAIHVGRFYMRRILRLVPALVLMVMTVTIYAAVWQADQLGKTVEDAFFIALYSFNWILVSQWPDVSLHQWMFSHVWSLSVEEQFYIVWPFLLIALHWFRAPKFVYLAIFTAGIIYPSVARAVLWDGSLALDLYFRTDLRIDGMMFGALVAWLTVNNLQPSASWNRVVAWAGFAAFGGLLWIAHFELLKNGWAYLGAFTLVNLLSAVIIASMVWSPLPLLRWVLQMPWLRWIGRVSYGTYLWHWPIMRLLHDWNPGFWTKNIITFALIYAITALSFYCVERRFLRLKHRFSSITQTSTPYAGQSTSAVTSMG